MNTQDDPFNIDIGPIGQDPDDVNYLEVPYDDEDSDEEGDTTTETVSVSNEFNPNYPVLENPEQFNLLDFQPYNCLLINYQIHLNQID